jgi:serine/threonine protein kinase
MRSTTRGKHGLGATASGSIRLRYVGDPAGADRWLHPGASVARRYQLEEPLPARTRGVLWQARQLPFDTRVTLQLLDSLGGTESELPGGFLMEAQAAAAVDHPQVARIVDYGVCASLAFLVFERLEGESLAARLSMRRRLPLGEVELVLRDAACGVGALHAEGIIHRRLDPAHLFLARAGDRAVTKVLFGLDELLGDSSQLLRTLARQLGESAPLPAPDLSASLGLPPPLDATAYQSPEHVLGRGTLDARSDLWSLGVIAYECTYGVPAFPGATLGERLVRICNGAPAAPPEHLGLPQGLGGWFARALHKEPSQRFASSAELHQSFSSAAFPEGAPH